MNKHYKVASDMNVFSYNGDNDVYEVKIWGYYWKNL